METPLYYSKGRRQNTSVETGDFLQKNIKCMFVKFSRSVTPSPHDRVKGYLGDDSQLLLYNTWYCLFVKWRQQSPTVCKGLNIDRMQAFVMLPTEFDNLLLNAAGYFDISPNTKVNVKYGYHLCGRFLHYGYFFFFCTQHVLQNGYFFKASAHTSG